MCEADSLQYAPGANPRLWSRLNRLSLQHSKTQYNATLQQLHVSLSHKLSECGSSHVANSTVLLNTGMSCPSSQACKAMDTVEFDTWLSKRHTAPDEHSAVGICAQSCAQASCDGNGHHDCGEDLPAVPACIHQLAILHHNTEPRLHRIYHGYACTC